MIRARRRSITPRGAHSPVVRQILVIAIPASVQFIVSYLQLSADMAFVGNYDTAGLAAIHNVRTTYQFLLAFLLAFTNGTRVLVSRSIGSGNLRTAAAVRDASLLFNQLLSFGYFAFWQIGGRSLLATLGAEADVLEMGWSYVRVLSFVFLFNGLALTSVATLQGEGRTVPIAIAAVIRTFVNLPLDWLLIYGRWGFPEMGIAGAALATLIAEFAGWVYVSVALLRADGARSFRRGLVRRVARMRRVLLSLYRRVASIGLPSALEALTNRAGSVGLLALLNLLSRTAAGHYGVIVTVRTLSTSLYFGASVATMTLVCMAVGAKDHERGRRVSRTVLAMAFFVCALVAVLFLAAPKSVVGLFVDDLAVVRELAPLMVIVSITLFPQALNVVSGSSLIARGYALSFLKVQVVGTVLLLPLAWAAMFPLGWGLRGLLWVVFLDELWRGTANGLILRRVSRPDRPQAERRI
jgi:multidrug resistance protein, MATE family